MIWNIFKALIDIFFFFLIFHNTDTRTRRRWLVENSRPDAAEEPRTKVLYIYTLAIKQLITKCADLYLRRNGILHSIHSLRCLYFKGGKRLVVRQLVEEGRLEFTNGGIHHILIVDGMELY